MDIWSIVIGDTVVRLGPAVFSKHQFKNRNKFVGRSSTAATFTDAVILTHLEQNGAKDIYRRTSEDGSTDVFVVFDSEISYRNAVTKSVWMKDINLKFTPQTQYSDTKSSRFNNRRQLNSRSTSKSRSNSPQTNYRSPDSSHNTYAVLDNLNNIESTGANQTPLGQRDNSPMLDSPHRS